MDPVRNPFAPGAGTPPPELVGRADIIEGTRIAVARATIGKPARSWMLLGLRGTGKTVLLNHISRLAQGQDALTAMIEAPQTGKLPTMLYPVLRSLLLRMSPKEAARELTHKAMRALRSFGASFKLEYEGYSLAVDPEPGVADTGELDLDLSDLMVAVGRAAQADGRAVILLIDEVQYLDKRELGAVIAAIHQTNQMELPVLFIGAGLPQVAALSGNAKSYAERLFEFHEIGPLSDAEAARAIREPVVEEGEAITDDAVAEIVADTQGYPYFLQEWGYQAWNTSDASPIDRADVERASARALERLDKGFFKVRMDRLTPGEREYVYTMAELPGDGPYRSGDVADALGKKANHLAPRRQKIIEKGMIYSPSHGDIAFTVPGFKDYVARLKGWQETD